MKGRTRPRSPAKKRDTCRVPLLQEDDQRTWLARKSAGAAAIESVALMPRQPLFFRRGNRAGHLVTISFEGVLRVQEPALLVALLENGVSPAKAFGCGLLLVRRLG